MKIISHILVRIVKKIEGFTLVEAMVGIFVISVVIGGPLVLAGRAAQDIRFSKEVFNASYLAEEAVELVRFKRETLLLECGDPASTICQKKCLSSSGAGCLGYSSVPGITETNGEASWRLFKEQFGWPSAGCFSSSGCSFDLQSVLFNASSTPNQAYDPATQQCHSLYVDRSAQLEATTTVTSSDFMYTCLTHKTPKAIDSEIRRVVYMTSTSTAPAGPNYERDYADDIRVDVKVFFKYKGFDRNVTMTDFIKARS